MAVISTLYVSLLLSILAEMFQLRSFILFSHLGDNQHKYVASSPYVYLNERVY